MKSYNEIKTEKEQKFTALIKDCRMFFAFSSQQFKENKTEKAADEKYLSLGAGAYMPKSMLNTWEEGSKSINAWFKNEVKKAKQEEAQILYELQNYECFYTGDISDAFEVLKNSFSLIQVQNIYNKHRKTEQQN